MESVLKVSRIIFETDNQHELNTITTINKTISIITIAIISYHNIIIIWEVEQIKDDPI